MNEDLILIKQLEDTREQHRRLDQELGIATLDEFSRQRLKKEKLRLRDEIYRLEQMVYPDIIA